LRGKSESGGKRLAVALLPGVKGGNRRAWGSRPAQLLGSSCKNQETPGRGPKKKRVRRVPHRTERGGVARNVVSWGKAISRIPEGRVFGGKKDLTLRRGGRIKKKSLRWWGLCGGRKHRGGTSLIPRAEKEGKSRETINKNRALTKAETAPRGRREGDFAAQRDCMASRGNEISKTGAFRNKRGCGNIVTAPEGGARPSW